MSVAGGTPVPIVGQETYQDGPTWSPDGEWIAYLSGEGDDLALRKTQIGSQAAPITLLNNVPPFLTRPQWSPKGDWILCETSEGLTKVAADGSSKKVLAEIGWFAFAWDDDNHRIYGLRKTDDEHHFMFVELDAETGRERVLNPNLGAVPQGLQPIRGLARLHGRGFITSIANVRSDIYFIENFRFPPDVWERFWRLPGAGTR